MSAAGSGTRSNPIPVGDLAGPLLEISELRTYFETARGTVRAVDGVSLSLEQGHTLGVVGESGSGKTVLCKSIMGLLPRRNVARSGTVRLAGMELTAMSEKQLRDVWGAQVGIVFQDPMTSLNPVRRVGGQITESLRHHLGMDRKTADETALALLRSVGVPEPERRRRQYPFQLSGGLRQRVTIAIALACGPRLLLADEPTTALDVTVQAQILRLLADQQRDRQMALVHVSHDLNLVAASTDDLAVMYAGKIVEKVPTRVLFSETRMPYTEALTKSVPRVSNPSHTRLSAIPGRPPDLAALPRGCSFAPRCPYAQERCREEEPPLRPAETPGHLFACWYPVGTPEGTAALERNRRAGSVPMAAGS